MRKGSLIGVSVPGMVERLGCMLKILITDVTNSYLIYRLGHCLTDTTSTLQHHNTIAILNTA